MGTPQIIKSSVYFINSPTLTQQRFSDFQFALSQLHQFSLKLWMELHRAAVWKQANPRDSWTSQWQLTVVHQQLRLHPKTSSAREKWSPIQNSYPKNKTRFCVFFEATQSTLPRFSRIPSINTSIFCQSVMSSCKTGRFHHPRVLES